MSGRVGFCSCGRRRAERAAAAQAAAAHTLCHAKQRTHAPASSCGTRPTAAGATARRRALTRGGGRAGTGGGGASPSSSDTSSSLLSDSGCRVARRAARATAAVTAAVAAIAAAAAAAAASAAAAVLRRLDGGGDGMSLPSPSSLWRWCGRERRVGCCWVKTQMAPTHVRQGFAEQRVAGAVRRHRGSLSPAGGLRGR